MAADVVSIFVGFSSVAVAVATFLLWKATKKIAKATNATNDMAREVGTYSIIPRFELIHHERKQEDGYHQYAVKIINNGKDTSYNVKIKTNSNNQSSSTHVSFNLPVGWKIWIAQSVKPDEKIIHFKIDFEDVAGNHHTRKLDYEITNEKCMGDSINWNLNEPSLDEVRI